MRKIVSAVALFGSAAALAWAGSAFAYTGQQYEHMAKITMAQATQIAQKAQQGKVTDSELEK